MSPNHHRPISSIPLEACRTALLMLGLAVGPLSAPSSAETGPFLGSASRVNTTTQGSQNSPRADQNAAGAAVVVWNCPDGDGQGICGQRIGAAGVAVGPELPINTTETRAQQYADVAVAPDGSFLVVWESFGQDGDDWGVYGRLFDRAGREVVAEKRLSAASAKRQRFPVVAARPNGWVVAWQSNHDDTFEQIYLRRFDAALKPLGGDVRVNAVGPGSERSAAIASDAKGAFVIAWEALSDEVFARRYAASGSPLGGPFEVNRTSNALGDPEVDMASDGAFAIAWQGLDDDSSGIWARPFTPSGAAAGPERMVNHFEDRLQTRPSIAIAEDRSYLVSWQSFAQQAPSEHALYVRPFSASGQPTDGEILVAQRASWSSVSIDASGEALFVWQGSGPDVLSRRWQPVRGACSEADHALCLSQDRFRVKATWRLASGASGSAGILPLTADTGTFWFFDAGNLEAVVKVLDACPVNGRHWVFAAGLTDLGVDLAVTDTVSGDRRVYRRAPGTPFAPVQDTATFAGCSSSRASGRSRDGSAARHIDELTALLSELERRAPTRVGIELAAGDAGRPGAGKASCVSTPTALCLGGRRFRVEASFAAGGSTGVARALELTDDSGTFWFFSQANVELLVKVLDGCGVNDRFWMFAAGLTDVGVELTLTDTVTGTSRSWKTRGGEAFQPILETSALAVCDR